MSQPTFFPPGTSMTPEAFRSFVKEQLKRARVDAEHREIFANEKNIKTFLKAVTHDTFDPVNNYQELEFIGDGIIKGILSQYIVRRFVNLKPEGITREGLFSKIRIKLEQTKSLGVAASRLGFWDFVQCGEVSEKCKINKNKVLEDVFEAFIGALTEVIDTEVKRGLGYNYAYNYMESILNDTYIDTSEESVTSAITRLQELYNAKELANGKFLKWGYIPYFTTFLKIPTFAAPPTQSLQPGHAYFSTTNNRPFIFDGQKWIDASEAPLVSIEPYPTDVKIDPETEKPTNIKEVWYAGIYGYPDYFGKRIPYAPKDEKTAIPVLKAPEKYGADIISQVLRLGKKDDARDLAAQHALKFLKSYGYYK